MTTPLGKKDLAAGEHYVLTYTRPMYDKSERRYLPDNFRFVDPEIRSVAYGGRCPDRRYCAVCGRQGKDSHMFLDLETFRELFISPHCLAHDSTRLWRDGTDTHDIEQWYGRESLKRGYEAGDPLAGAAVMFGALDDDELWE